MKAEEWFKNKSLSNATYRDQIAVPLWNRDIVILKDRNGRMEKD